MKPGDVREAEEVDASGAVPLSRSPGVEMEDGGGLSAASLTCLHLFKV